MVARLLSSAGVRLALGTSAVFGLSALGLIAVLWWATLGLLNGQVDTAIRVDAQGLAEQWRQGGRPQYSWLAEILEKLAQLPTPQEVLDWKLSPATQAQIDALLEKNRAPGLTPEEEQEWQCFEQVEHFARLAKSRAFAKLQLAA